MTQTRGKSTFSKFWSSPSKQPTYPPTTSQPAHPPTPPSRPYQPARLTSLPPPALQCPAHSSSDKTRLDVDNDIHFVRHGVATVE